MSKSSTSPQENLLDLAEYIEYWRFKASKVKKPAESSTTLRIINLEGLLKGYDFSPELIAEARRKMWRKFYDEPV
jgi:hypothetical protein